MVDDRYGPNDRCEPAEARPARAVSRDPTGILIASAIIGGVIGLAIGFSVYQFTGGLRSIVGFITEFKDGQDAVFWIGGGAVVGVATAYLFCRISN